MKGLKNVFSAVGSLLAIGLFVVAVAPVQAGEVTDRIQALEQELTQLKGEQVEIREAARAARAKLPSIKYRNAGGMRIAGGDKSWKLRVGARLMPYMTFWLDDNRHRGGTPQGVLQIRRFRPYWRYYLQNDFYELRHTHDGETNNAFDAEMYLHFEQLSPWAPTIGYGATPSLRFNPQSANLSSGNGSRSEMTFLENGTGMTTAGVDRGILAEWRNIPRFGMAKITFVSFGIGVDRAGDNALDSFAGNITQDGKSFTTAIGIKPFDRSGVGWLKNLEISLGTMFQESPNKDGQFREWAVEADQLRGNQIEFWRIADGKGDGGHFKYYSPGVGWKMGPVAVHYSHNIAHSHVFNDSDFDNVGGLIKAQGMRLLWDIWVWGPKKGWLSGSTRSGGLMFSPMFQKAQIKAGDNSNMDTCGGGTYRVANCKSAHATNTGIALWYYIPGGFYNLGVVWDHWRATNMNDDMSNDIFGLTPTDSRKEPGGQGTFNTLTFITRFRW